MPSEPEISPEGQYLKWVPPTYIFYGSNMDDTPYGRIESALASSMDIDVRRPGYSESSRHMSGSLRNVFGVLTHERSLGIVQHDTIELAGIDQEPLKSKDAFIPSRMKAISPLYMERLHVISSVKKCGYVPYEKVKVRDLILSQCVAIPNKEKGHLVAKAKMEQSRMPELFNHFDEELGSGKEEFQAIRKLLKIRDVEEHIKAGASSDSGPMDWEIPYLESGQALGINCGSYVLNEATESNAIHRSKSALMTGTPGSSSSSYAPFILEESAVAPFYPHRSMVATSAKQLLSPREVEKKLSNKCDALERLYNGEPNVENSKDPPFSRKRPPVESPKAKDGKGASVDMRNATPVPVFVAEVRMFMSGTPYPDVERLIRVINMSEDQSAFLIGLDVTLIHKINKEYGLGLIPTDFREGSYQQAFGNRKFLSPDFLPTAGAYAWLVGSSSLSKTDTVMVLKALGEGIEQDERLAEIFSNPPISLDDIRRGIENEVALSNSELLVSFVIFILLVFSLTLGSFSVIIWVVSVSLKTRLSQALTPIYEVGVFEARRSYEPEKCLKVIEQIEEQQKKIHKFSVKLREKLGESWLIDRHYREIMSLVDDILKLTREEYEREMTAYILSDLKDKNWDALQSQILKSYAKAYLSLDEFSRLQALIDKNRG